LLPICNAGHYRPAACHCAGQVLFLLHVVATANKKRTNYVIQLLLNAADSFILTVADNCN